MQQHIAQLEGHVYRFSLEDELLEETDAVADPCSLVSGTTTPRAFRDLLLDLGIHIGHLRTNSKLCQELFCITMFALCE